MHKAPQAEEIWGLEAAHRQQEAAHRGRARAASRGIASTLTKGRRDQRPGSAVVAVLTQVDPLPGAERRASLVQR